MASIRRKKYAGPLPDTAVTIIREPTRVAELVVPGQGFGLGKISALGIKVSRHCSYHGVALNVDMDLEPFHRINPCGYVGLQTVDLAFCGVYTSWEEAASRLGEALAARLSP